MIMEETLMDILKEHSRMPPHILIAGLGNVLLKDDGVGVHAVRELRKNPPPGALAVEIGTAFLDALHLLAWADRILAIDAMKAGGPPGTIYVCRGQDVEERSVKTSLHETSLFAALQFLPEWESCLDIWVLGMEPETIDYGMELSPPLSAGLPLLVRAARDIVSSWRRPPSPRKEREAFSLPSGPSCWLLGAGA